MKPTASALRMPLSLRLARSPVMGDPYSFWWLTQKIDQEKISLMKCAVGLESVPLEKVHSINWRRSFRSIGSYITKLCRVKHILVDWLMDSIPLYLVACQN
jgi:hypothetical protein